MRARLVVETLCIQILLTLSVSQLWAGCLNPPVSPRKIDQFKASPQGLVAPDSDNRKIEALVRDLAGSDPSLAADLVHVTVPQFQTAIAAGLAQAAIACTNVDQQAALLIQQAVASFRDGQFQASFAAVAGDLSTGATAAATASAKGSAGSVVVTNPNTSPTSGSTFSGGGSNAPVQFAFTSVTTHTTNNNNANNKATTAVDPVSSAR
jgi:hypothetical protein